MKFDKGVGDLGLTVTCSYVKLVIFFSENLPFSPWRRFVLALPKTQNQINLYGFSKNRNTSFINYLLNFAQ